MKRQLVLLILFTFSSCKEKLIEIPFPNLKYDKVVAYKMNGMENEVIESNKLSNNVENRKKTLSPEQRIKLISILNSKSTYGGVPAKCFEPHLGFVFYRNDDQILAHSTICLTCNWMSSNPDIKEFAFSKKGSKAIQDLENEIFSQ